VKELAAFLFSVVLDLFAEDFFRAGFVAVGIEGEVAADEGTIDGPAGEHARDLRYVGLRVAAVDAEGVEFHQLAGVIFVEAFMDYLPGAARGGEVGTLRCERVGADAAGVVEINEHGWAVRYGFKQVFKFAEGTWANGVALIADEVVRHLLVFAEVDVEVIEPEVGHDFLKLGAGVDVAGEALGHELFCDEALGVFECAYGLLLAGGEIGVEGDALDGLEGLDESFKLLGLHCG
jgi:hypothetical protein